MKKIKTIFTGLSLLFVLSCVNQQNANKPVKTPAKTACFFPKRNAERQDRWSKSIF